MARDWTKEYFGINDDGSYSDESPLAIIDRQQAEINRLREVIKRVDGQIHRIKDCPRNTTAFWQIESAKIGLNEALNGESEKK